MVMAGLSHFIVTRENRIDVHCIYEVESYRDLLVSVFEIILIFTLLNHGIFMTLE